MTSPVPYTLHKTFAEGLAILCFRHSSTTCSTPFSIEFIQICRAVAVGFAVMGFIGYFVKLIHIPMYVPSFSPPLTLTHFLFQKQYPCVCLSFLPSRCFVDFFKQWRGMNILVLIAVAFYVVFIGTWPTYAPNRNH